MGALAPTDFRARALRFSEEDLVRSLVLVEALRSLTDEVGASVAQLATLAIQGRHLLES